MLHDCPLKTTHPCALLRFQIQLISKILNTDTTSIGLRPSFDLRSEVDLCSSTMCRAGDDSQSTKMLAVEKHVAAGLGGEFHQVGCKKEVA